MNRILAITLALTVTGSASLAIAQDGGPHDKAITARQAMFQLYSFNIGILGGMAKGKIDYDAELAAEAAANLDKVVNLGQSAFWPQGSDNSNSENKETRALPKLWNNFPDVSEKAGNLAEAVAALQPVAAGGVDGLKGAVGDVGKACKACHDDYRAEKD